MRLGKTLLSLQTCVLPAKAGKIVRCSRLYLLTGKPSEAGFR